LGGVAGLREDIGAPVPLVERAAHERTIVAVRDRVGGATAFDREWQWGRALAAETPEKVLERAWLALSQAAPPAA
jgi:hypothetical protein